MWMCVSPCTCEVSDGRLHRWLTGKEGDKCTMWGVLELLSVQFKLLGADLGQTAV